MYLGSYPGDMLALSCDPQSRDDTKREKGGRKSNDIWIYASKRPSDRRKATQWLSSFNTKEQLYISTGSQQDYEFSSDKIVVTNTICFFFFPRVQVTKRMAIKTPSRSAFGGIQDPRVSRTSSTVSYTEVFFLESTPTVS